VRIFHSNEIHYASIALLAGDTSSIELLLNIANGRDFSISEMAVAIIKMIDYKRNIEWNTITVGQFVFD
jgi:hypothetical protein